MQSDQFPRSLPKSPMGEQHDLYVDNTHVPLEPEHNNAYDSGVTRVFARMFENIAEPLNEHIYGPITRKNRLLGMVVANLTLTAPRLLEPLAGEKYIQHLEAGHTGRAFGYLAIKAGLKFSDGLDGPVTRANGITSEFGGGFDGFTDMIGTHDDGVRIKQAHNHLGISDLFTESVIDVRTLEDVGAAFLNLLNAKVTRGIKKQGIPIPDRDKPRANAPAKAKFFLSTVGDAVTLLGTLSKKPERQNQFKKVGVAILAGSAIAGAVSLFQYQQSLKRNLALAEDSNDRQDWTDARLNDNV